jgi:hypothetical protein
VRAYFVGIVLAGVSLKIVGCAYGAPKSRCSLNGALKPEVSPRITLMYQALRFVFVSCLRLIFRAMKLSAGARIRAQRAMRRENAPAFPALPPSMAVACRDVRQRAEGKGRGV